MPKNKFTQKEAKEMYDALATIHNDLQIKNYGGTKKKISILEYCWYHGLDNILDRIDKRLGNKKRIFVDLRLTLKGFQDFSDN